MKLSALFEESLRYVIGAVRQFLECVDTLFAGQLLLFWRERKIDKLDLPFLVRFQLCLV